MSYDRLFGNRESEADTSSYAPNLVETIKYESHLLRGYSGPVVDYAYLNRIVARTVTVNDHLTLFRTILESVVQQVIEDLLQPVRLDE